MKRLLFSLILVISGFAAANADPLFPIFIDLIGGNEYIPHSTFVEGYPKRNCQNYAPVSDWFQKNENRVFSFLNDVLPQGVLDNRKEGEQENCKFYTYSDLYSDGEMISFLTVAVYADNTIGIEYIEAENPNYKK